MPRVGLNSEHLGKASLNFGTGNARVVNAVIVNHQFPPNKTTGDQEELRPKIRWSLQRMDADWKPTDDDPIDEYVALAGKGGLNKFHPGNATSREDEDPEDLGDGEGTEGNCIYPVEEGAKVDPRTKAGLLILSMEASGYQPKEITGFFPEFIGLEAHFVTKKMKSDAEGMRDWDVLLVDRINRLPYQKGGATVKKAAPAPTAAKAAAGKVNGAAATAPAPVPTAPAITGDAAEQTEALATMVMAKIGERKAGTVLSRGLTGLAAQRIPSQIAVVLGLPEIRAQVPVKFDKGIRDLIANDEFFLGAAAELGWEVDGVNVTVPA